MSVKSLDLRYLKDKYVLCICEGTAEEVIINRLLDEDCLVFKRENMIDKAPTRIRDAQKIESTFLNRDFEREVVILRVIDSRKENFRLGKLYQDRFTVKNIYTTPEIEMLMVWGEDRYKAFRKSKMKPSDFMASIHANQRIKSEAFLLDYYEDIDYLLSAIEKYNQDASHRGELGLYQLTKRAYEK